MSHEGYLGIDVGSISTKIIFTDVRSGILASSYLRTHGDPVQAIKAALRSVREQLGEEPKILGAGATGSARSLAGCLIGADIVRNEITAHGLAAIHLFPDVRTVIEIGGQDSKIIIIRDGIILDFGMNTVCAAGTGSFLDHQAFRLGIPIEQFGHYARSAGQISPIAGRCTVFAESDMIHKQQMGYDKAEIIAGLCEALVRNYLNNVAKGKEIVPPILFQGGVAANHGIKDAFERILKNPVTIPERFDVMGAFGAALLAFEAMSGEPRQSAFRGFDITDHEFQTRGFLCGECPNNCEVIEFILNRVRIAVSGDRCGRYEEELSIVKTSPTLVECRP